MRRLRMLGFVASSWMKGCRRIGSTPRVVVHVDTKPTFDADGWPVESEDEWTEETVVFEGRSEAVEALEYTVGEEQAEDGELRRLLAELRADLSDREDETSAEVLRSVSKCEAYIEEERSMDVAADARAALAFAATTSTFSEREGDDVVFEDERSLGVLEDEERGLRKHEDDEDECDESFDEAYGRLMSSSNDDVTTGGARPTVSFDSVRVGIDLGTTNSAAAVVAGGVARLVPPGSRPSVVCFVDTAIDDDLFVKEDDDAVAVALRDDEGENGVLVVVGSDAEAMRGGSHGASVCSRVKRILGRDATGAEKRRVAACRMRGGRGSDAEVTLNVPALPNRIAAAEVSAEIVRQLRRDANNFLYDEDDDVTVVARRAVIGVPARFDAAAREATLTAAYLGGFDQAALVTEPEAAALAYAAKRRRDDREDAETVLVFDLGGGTFDASVVQISPKGDKATLISIGGDARLGGDDFDAALAEYLAKRFYDVHGVTIQAPTARIRLLAEAERCKRELSSRTSVVAKARCLARASKSGERMRGGQCLDLEEKITRRGFEKLCKPLLRDVETEARSVCELAEVALPGQEGDTHIDAVLLVGAATRMPAIGRMLRRMTGLPLSKICSNDDLNPDEAVALGCAILANELDVRDGFRPPST